ncbi:MAG: DUF4163 domain-containing protein [Lachnospiraceae bacterium]|nr:DUF4163 domain-containing protein [Lachnospiraceae bacterium]
MKQKNIPLLIIVMILLSICTACAGNDLSSGGEKEEEQSDILLNAQTEETQAKESQTEDIQTNEIPTEGISDSADTINAQDVDDTNTAQSAFPGERTTSVSPVRLVFCTEEQITKMKDDTILSRKRYIYPVVTIEGNENAADKINADIQETVNSSRVDTFNVPDTAAYIYDVEAEYRFNYCTEGYLWFTAVRADSKVISFLVCYQQYTGGMIILRHYTGLNYDTQTGELIEFADLSEHADVFEQETFAYLKALALTKETVWKDIDEMLKPLYQSNRWYLSTSGLVFCSYNGLMEYTIPYSDLEEIGLKEKYDCEGIRTFQLQRGEGYSSDLNGDGQEEDIQFYIDETGSADTNIHLIIDGTDYAVELEELSRQLSDDDLICWVECYLYKTDKTDTTTEIAFEMNYTSLKDDVVTPCTFRYRYEGNGGLTSLGRMEGMITDPTVVLPQDSAADEQ